MAQPRLVFRPTVANDECLLRAEQVASTVLNTLRDTPMSAVGINFAFTEPDPPPELLNVFNFPDGPALVGADWDVRARRVVRRLAHDDTVLNLTLEFDGQVVTFEFNFHADTPTNADACAAVNARAVGLRDDAVRLLGDVYHLQLVEENGNHE
ncbi:MAG TPA: hypothetical protein VFB30_18760 [Spirochaetia bacterium]|nr:hypothetical protein [Spirochaetia bacterium]